MQILRTTLLLLAAAAGSLPCASSAQADGQKTGGPGANEVILHVDPYFGSGAGYRFQLDPQMPQRVLVFHHAGQILRRNFRSVQVGRDVVASLYEAVAGSPGAGTNRKLLTRSTTNIEPRYSIVVINRKRDGVASNGYRGLPFRVSLSAQWKPFLSAGRLHVEDFFVPQSAAHPSCYDVGRTLERQGADDLMILTGRYPVTALHVTLFDQAGCRGANARTFPNAPGNAASVKLWDYGFGDKARSLKLRWSPLKFQVPKDPKAKHVPKPPPAKKQSPKKSAPNQGAQPPVKPQFVIPDVKGHWKNQFGWKYVFGTNAGGFAWKLEGSKEEGRGTFDSTTVATIRWTTHTGEKKGPIMAFIEHDGKYVATRIVAANGVVFTRR